MFNEMYVCMIERFYVVLVYLTAVSVAYYETVNGNGMIRGY
jgi:hypothetical protein